MEVGIPIILLSLLVFLLAVVGIGICLVPWIIAKSRGHNNSLAILVCSIAGIFIFGITFGTLWFVALIWAFTSNTK